MTFSNLKLNMISQVFDFKPTIPLFFLSYLSPRIFTYQHSITWHILDMPSYAMVTGPVRLQQLILLRSTSSCTDICHLFIQIFTECPHCTCSSSANLLVCSSLSCHGVCLKVHLLFDLLSQSQTPFLTIFISFLG